MIHLHNTRIRIEKFVYENGTNVALYNAEHSKRYIAFKKALKKALYSQINAIAEYKDTLPLLMSLAKVKPTTSELLGQVSVLVNKNGLYEKVDLSAYLTWAGEQGGQAALDKLGIQAIFGLKDQRIIDYFSDYSRLTINSVDDYTKQWIAGKIQEGKDAGLTPFQIQQLLREDGDAISAIRSERIVLTETAKAMSTVELQAAMRYGIVEKIWRTSLDERVCPICSPAEGERAAIDATFGAVDVSYPPAHVSCRCYLEEVIPDNWVLPDKIWLGE